MRLILACLLACALSGTGIAQTAPDPSPLDGPFLLSQALYPDPVLAVSGFSGSVAFWKSGEVTVLGDEQDVVSDFWPILSTEPYPFNACISSLDADALSFTVTHSYALVVSSTDTQHADRSWSVSIGVDEFEIVGPVSLDARRLWSKLANELTRRCRLRKALETVPHA